MIDQISINQVAGSPISLSSKANKMGAADLGEKFGDFLNEAMNSLSNQQKNVEGLEEAFVKGDLPITDAHQLTIAAEQALIAIETTVQIRNKAIEAYQEIMRMQI
ncbi:flagellar hook-basal body complex protein FliE [Paenibacillus albiflavus]|uniref:flagellar hook-basal body complex protein FliE n=1 Tax=Paenibacillus albiflavus TaxID=2545760 RepID=UPI0014055937|nr:flagellar hook-basal body complex protein FliE [Paenibacillus albiflavus]